MKVLFASSEAAPFAKTGGLADVSGSLPLEIGKLGARVRIVMPRYRGLPAGKKKLSENVDVCFIEHEGYYNRSSLYGNDGGEYTDNLERFSFFCQEALSSAKAAGFRPDIVHAHDWQTALLPVLLKTRHAEDAFFGGTKSLLTIHNLQYQGTFGRHLFSKLGLPDSLFSIDGFEFYGRINLLKAGILYADYVNTVSPTYAREVQTHEFGFGLEGVIHQRADRFRGILNGIDTVFWNPARDARIKKTYSAALLAGKAACKRDLQKKSGFEISPAIPLFGMVARLTEQKGLELFTDIADKFLSQGIQFVILGEGDPVYKTAFRNIAHRHPKNAAAYLGFNAAEAHRIYAGSDFFMMPSFFEPCGLGQMISLRYGAIPIVRKTGGLADTIKDADEHPRSGNGFVFAERIPEKLLAALMRATECFEDKKRFIMLQKRAMRCNFSWKKSAAEYLKLYRDVLK